MAIEVIKRVAPSGGDYTTLTAAIADLPADLVAIDTYYIIEIEDFGAAGLSGTYTISGVTADATRTLEIRAAAGHEYDLGTKAGAFLVGGINYGSVVNLNVAYSVLKGIKLKNTFGTASHAYGGSSTGRRIEDCVLEVPIGTGGNPLSGNNSRDIYVKNSVLIGGNYNGYLNNYTYDAVLENVTCINPAISAVQANTGTSATLINVLHYGSGSFKTGTGFNEPASSNNATSSESAGVGSGFITGVTSDNFVDYDNGDYRIAAGSAMAIAGIGAFIVDGGAPAGYPVELLATAAITLSAEKIGQAVAGLNTAAAAAVTAHKIAQAQLAVSASAATSVAANKIGQSLLPVAATSSATIAANKIGFGTASLNASADINLISGNVIVVEATINFTAAASIGLSGQKQGAGSVAFLSAANSQLSASKTGTASVNLTAGSLASLAANKMGAAAASLQCAVVHSLLSSKTGYSSFTVPVSISITLSGLSAATKPVARAVFINTSSQQKSLLTTSSEQKRRITTHSRQRYSLQSGGVSV